MSLFGVDQTTLAAATGAGSQPLSPVQQPAYRPAYGAALEAIGGMGVAYAQYEASKSKNAEPPWMQVRNEFQSELSTLLQQRSTAADSITARQADTRIKQLYTRYMADGAAFGEEFAKSLHNTYTYMKTGTDLSTIQDTVKDETQLVNESLRELSKAGLLQGVDVTQMSEATKLKWFDTYQGFQQMEAEAKRLEAQYQRTRQQWQDSNTEEDQEWKRQERYRETQARNVFGQVSNSAIESLTSTFGDLSKNILPDGSNFQLIQGQMQEMGQRLKVQYRQVLSGDPESLKGFENLIDSLVKDQTTVVDPKVTDANLKSAMNNRINIKKQLLLEDHKNLPILVAMEDWFPGVANTVAGQTELAPTLRAVMNSQQSRLFTPVAEGDVASQKLAFDAVVRNEQRITNGEASGTKLKDINANTAIGALNALAGLPEGASPRLNEFTNFIATPEFGKMVREGRIPDSVREKAIPAFQDTYLSGWRQNVKKWLATEVASSSTSAPSFVHSVRFELTPDGTIVGKVAQDPTRDYSDRTYDSGKVQARATRVANEINKNISAMANLMGETDKAKVWKEMRGIMFQGYYPTADQEEAFMAENPEWDGVGFPHNRSSYKPKSTNE